MSDGGKGSTPRPFSVDNDTFANNWDAIFKKKPKQDDENHGTISDDEKLEDDRDVG